MPRGRKTEITIRLAAEERQTLMACQRSTKIPAARARRGRIILLIAEGVPLIRVAAMVGMAPRGVYRWARRFLAERLAGLDDKPGRGRRPRLRQPDRT